MRGDIWWLGLFDFCLLVALFVIAFTPGGAVVVALCPGLVRRTLTAIVCPNAGGGLVRDRVLTSAPDVGNVGIGIILLFPESASPFLGDAIGTTRTTVRCRVSGRMRIRVIARFGSTPHPRMKGVLPRIGGIVTMDSNGNKMNGDAISTGLTVTLTGLNCGINLLSASVFNPSVPGVFNMRRRHPCSIRGSNESLVRPMRGCNIGLLDVNFFMDPAATAL